MRWNEIKQNKNCKPGLSWAGPASLDWHCQLQKTTGTSWIFTYKLRRLQLYGIHHWLYYLNYLTWVDLIFRTWTSWLKSLDLTRNIWLYHFDLSYLTSSPMLFELGCWNRGNLAVPLDVKDPIFTKFKSHVSCSICIWWQLSWSYLSWGQLSWSYLSWGQMSSPKTQYDSHNTTMQNNRQ